MAINGRGVPRAVEIELARRRRAAKLAAKIQRRNEAAERRADAATARTRRMAMTKRRLNNSFADMAIDIAMMVAALARRAVAKQRRT